MLEVPSGIPGGVRGPSIRFGTGREVLQGVCDGRAFGRSETSGEVLRKVWDGSGDPPKDPGQDRGHSRRSVTGWGTLPEVWDRLGDTPGGLVQAGGHSRRSGTGRKPSE